MRPPISLTNLQVPMLGREFGQAVELRTKMQTEISNRAMKFIFYNDKSIFTIKTYDKIRFRGILPSGSWRLKLCDLLRRNACLLKLTTPGRAEASWLGETRMALGTRARYTFLSGIPYGNVLILEVEMRNIRLLNSCLHHS